MGLRGYQCGEELVPKIPTILRDGGFQVTQWQPKPNMHTVKPFFSYVVSDGIRTGAVSGEIEDGVAYLFYLPQWSWRFSAHIGKKKFEKAVVDCLIRAGVTEFKPNEKAA